MMAIAAAVIMSPIRGISKMDLVLINGVSKTMKSILNYLVAWLEQKYACRKYVLVNGWKLTVIRGDLKETQY